MSLKNFFPKDGQFASIQSQSLPVQSEKECTDFRSEQRIKIFTVLDYFLPGYKSGGPIRTLANMVDRLGDQFSFWIFTRDRDSGDKSSYPDIQVNAWNQLGKARVFYVPPSKLSAHIIFQLIKAVHPDIVYLNSFFSTFTVNCLLLFRLGLLPRIPLILAPRGEFSPGALRIKAAKKQPYLTLARNTGLYRNVIWQASSPHEMQDIYQTMGSDSVVHVAANLAPFIAARHDTLAQRPIKNSGSIRLIFLSRISAKKNLAQALQMIQQVKGQLILDIYGPIAQKDERYWQECQSIIAQMPGNIVVTYRGSIPNSEVTGTLAQYHFLLLPTLGENFGHIILEALTAGCPVLISDRTPWLDLAEKHVGWDLPLDNRDLWHAVLQQGVAMDNDVYQQLSQSARRFALEYIASPVSKQQNIELFMKALQSHSLLKQ